MNESSSGFPTFIIVIIVLIALWFILREFVCWYYKINERIALQKKTNELLEQLVRQTSRAGASNNAVATTTSVADLKIFIDEKKDKGFIISSKNISNGTAWATAKELCSQYDEGGFNDWRLPSKEELILIYESFHKQKTVEFNNGLYWSATEAGAYNSWAINFLNGTPVQSGRSYLSFVRAVRTF